MDNILKTVGIFNEMFMKEVEKVINNDNNNKETLGEKIHNAIREDIKNEKIIQELEEEKAVLNNSNISLQEEIKRLEISYKEAGNVIDNLRNEKNKLSNTITYLKNILEEIKVEHISSIENKNNAINHYLKECTDLREKNTSLLHKVNELDSVKLNRLFNENNNLKQQLRDLQKDSNSSKVIELQTTVGSLKVQLAESLSNSMKWKNEVENKDWELKEVKHDLDSYKKSDKEIREQNVKLKEKNNELHNKNNSLEIRNDDYKEKNNRQKEAIFKQSEELLHLKQQIGSINVVKEKATEILYKKSTEIFGNKHIFEQTIEEMAELMVEINKVRRANEGFDLTKINNLPQIMEEVCDVQMCLNHLKILFNETDFKNVQVKKFNKFSDHFKRQFNKKENEKKLNEDLKNGCFIKIEDIIELDNLSFEQKVNGCP